MIAGAHHEKLDGSGYPKGLGTEQLIPQVRILTISDIFDALTASDRPYREAYSIEKAVEILRAEAEEGKLDPALVEVFIDEVLPEIRTLVPRTH
jgi:3',5'-cyclic-nucleotide phosphodiesterase